MGLFRYIVQGFGWEIGSQAAREGIEKLRAEGEPLPQPSKRELARLARAREKHEQRERKEREAEAARKQAEIDEQLRSLKNKAGR